MLISAGLERERRHLSSVVSLKTLPESNPDDSAKTTSNQTPTQVTHCFCNKTFNFVCGLKLNVIKKVFIYWSQYCSLGLPSVLQITVIPFASVPMSSAVEA